ncbi:MAG: methylenetetrahydrofolate reductase [NAD(P)H] [Methyloligellaceae bacterium]
MNNSPDRLSRAVQSDDVQISFEFFPPKTEKMEEKLWASIKRLEPLLPRFISVTYGAGGSTRERTHTTLGRVLQETSLAPAAHLTCVNASKSEVNEVIESYRDIGVRHIVALRGDPPDGLSGTYHPHPEGYVNAADLVAGIRRIGGFEISVSAYPEKHPESASFDADMDMLKAKLEAGATRAITQFFFDNDHYFRYLDRVQAAGIDIPVTPGIIPIHNYKQIASFAKQTGTDIPDWLHARFDGLENDLETQKLVAASVAAEQVTELVDQGVSEFHFYTLNRADLVYAICHLLGHKPSPVPVTEAV